MLFQELVHLRFVEIAAPWLTLLREVRPTARSWVARLVQPLRHPCITVIVPIAQHCIAGTRDRAERPKEKGSTP